jgi:predicted nucleic acid-binding protein
MPYLLDSNWVIDYLGADQSATELIDSLVEAGIGISIITYLEVYQGVLRHPDPRLAEAQLTSLLTWVPLFPLTLAVARRCARVREQLRQQQKRVRARALDLIIAATALEHDLTLVTRNPDDFNDIPGLKLHTRD